jgi:hypothetical protein
MDKLALVGLSIFVSGFATGVPVAMLLVHFQIRKKRERSFLRLLNAFEAAKRAGR